MVEQPFTVDESRGSNTGGYNGVVVGDFRIVEHLFRFRQFLGEQRFYKFSIRCEFAKRIGHFGIDVVGEISGINAGVGGYFLFVERLN